MGHAASFRTPAAAYDRHIGRYGAELARGLCDAAGVAPGDRALDVGCGPGALTAELVARLGAERVAAVEPSPTFADACRSRLPGVHVAQAPAERLPFGDDAFDRALAQLVVNFLADAPAGVREMARVVRPGGTVAAAVWDYGDGMTLLRRFWDATVALDPSARDRDEARMPHCTPGALRDLWSAGGLRSVTDVEVVASARYSGFDDLWAGFAAGAGPAAAYTAGLDPARRAALRDEVRRRLGAGDAPFRLTARAWTVTGLV